MYKSRGRSYEPFFHSEGHFLPRYMCQTHETNKSGQSCGESSWRSSEQHSCIRKAAKQRRTASIETVAMTAHWVWPRNIPSVIIYLLIDKSPPQLYTAEQHKTGHFWKLHCFYRIYTEEPRIRQSKKSRNQRTLATFDGALQASAHSQDDSRNSAQSTELQSKALIHLWQPAQNYSANNEWRWAKHSLWIKTGDRRPYYRRPQIARISRFQTELIQLAPFLFFVSLDKFHFNAKRSTLHKIGRVARPHRGHKKAHCRLMLKKFQGTLK